VTSGQPAPGPRVRPGARRAEYTEIQPQLVSVEGGTGPAPNNARACHHHRTHTSPWSQPPFENAGGATPIHGEGRSSMRMVWPAMAGSEFQLVAPS